MDYTVGNTIYLMFTTRQFSDGVPTVLAGGPVVSAYENDSVTQITAGITLGVSHDSVVGMNLLTIVATGANGFEAGKDYSLVVTTGTVGGVSVVGEVVGTFSLSRSAAAVDLANATDGLGALKTLVDDVPTVSEFNARTLVSASYFDPAADTVALVTTVTTATNLTNLPSIPANWLTAAGIAAAALDGKGDWNTTTPPATSAIADAVWDELLAGHVIADSAGLVLNDWQDGGRLDLLLDAIPTTAMRGTDSAALASVCTEVRLAELDAANLPTDIADVPTVSEFNARTLVAASYFDPAADTVANVTTVATNTDMRGTDSAALASVLGGLTDAAAAGDPTATDTLIAYVKQLINTLEGAVGIPLYPAAADPGNNVSLAEAIRAIRDDVTGLAGATMRGTDSAATATALTAAQTDLDTLTGSDGATLATTQGNYAPAKAADVWSDSTAPAGTAMARAVDGIVLGTVSGAPTTTNIPTSSLAPAAVDIDQFLGRIMTFSDATTTAALRGQSTDITANTSAGVLTCTALTTAPVSGDVFTLQ